MPPVSRVLDDSHLRSLVLDYLTTNSELLPLMTVCKSWHVRICTDLLARRHPLT
jgi:hypothetical protein